MTELVAGLRLAAPAVAALATAAWFDLRLARSGLPPGFALLWRRVAAGLLLAALLYLALFLPLALPAAAVPPDLSTVRPVQLFTLHGLLVATLALWGLLAFGSGGAGRLAGALRLTVGGEPAAAEAREPGDETTGGAAGGEPGDGTAGGEPGDTAGRRIGREVALGLGAGLGIWAAVLLLSAALFAAVTALGGEALLPAEATPLVVLVASQPVWVRLAVSLSAGVVEETFFRGFLQPRLGLLASTGLFVLAHTAYGEPTMLITVTLLSLVYGLLARRRGNVWAAVAAHAVFDGVQLLVLLPAALKALE